MRTTVHLPAELLHAARVRAAERGETLQDLMTRAIARDLGVAAQPNATRRLEFPLIGRDGGQTVNVTSSDIAAALDAEDAERFASS